MYGRRFKVQQLIVLKGNARLPSIVSRQSPGFLLKPSNYLTLPLIKLRHSLILMEFAGQSSDGIGSHSLMTCDGGSMLPHLSTLPVGEITRKEFNGELVHR